MFTLEFSAVVAILVVACNANPLLRQNNMAPTSFNLNQITNALQAHNAMELRLEQQKQRQEMMELQYKAAEERRKLQLDLHYERLKHQLEQQQLQNELMQQNMLGNMLGTGANNLNTGAIQPTSLNGLLNPAGTNAAGNNILTSGASTSNLLGSVPNTLTPNANLLGNVPNTITPTINTFTGTNPFRPIVRLLSQAFAPQPQFAAPNTRQGQSTFTQGLQQTMSSNNQRQSFLI